METYTSASDPVVQAYASLLSKHCQQHQQQPVPPAPTPIRSYSTPVLPSSGRTACGTLLFDGHPAAFRSPFFAHPLSGYFTPMMMMPVGCWPITNKELSRIAHEATFGKPQPLFHDQNAWKDAITDEYARMTLHQSQLLEDAAQNKRHTPSPVVNPTNTAIITITTTTTPPTHTSSWNDMEDKPLAAVPSPSASYTTTSVSARDDDSTPTGSPSSSSPPYTPTSSRSVSPTPHKSRSWRRELRRELRRLRAENVDMQEQLRITREDLARAQESRLLAYQCHQRSLDQLAIDHEEEIEKYLEMGKEQQEAIREKDDEIARLKRMVVEAQRGAGAADEQAMKRRNALWDDHDVVSAETSEDDSGSDGERFASTDGKEVITQRMPIGWCEPPPSNEQIESEEDLEEEEETSPECFAVLAGSHLRQALVSSLSSAMTNLCLDDLVVKHDPRPDEVARALAAAFTDWAAERMASEQSKQTMAVLEERIRLFWRFVFQNFVRHDDEIQALLEGIEQRVGELEREERAGAKKLAGRYLKIVAMLCDNDVVDGEAVVEWWQKGIVETGNTVSGACHWRRPNRSKPTETDLRVVMREFVEWFQKDSSGDEEEDEEDEDSEEEESEEEEEEEEVDNDDEEMQDPAGPGNVCQCFEEDAEECVCDGGAAAQRKEKKSVRFEEESEM